MELLRSNFLFGVGVDFIFYINKIEQLIMVVAFI